ncbi:Xaa-Pro dipeptidyl-peptidase [uncultured bacterium]|nr:Xaa-Pro dipeptidyl-peptidase [uncultured bacterium]
MKDHQFALKPTKCNEMVKELKTIHFYNDQLAKLKPTKLLKTLLMKAFANEHSHTMKMVRLHDLMATPTVAADDYLAHHDDVSFNVFYNIALCMLHFDVDLDFQLSDPLKGLKKSNMPYLKPLDPKSMTTKEIFEAWYLLLCTHTKKCQTLLEELASAGYYKQFNDLPKPLFFNGKAQPVFDTSDFIHDIVYVEAPLDTDHDGKRDLLRTDVIRPRETEDGLKVPTVFTPSTYNLGTNDRLDLKMIHNVNVPLKHKQPNNYTYKDVTTHFDPTKNIPAPRKIKKTTKKAEASSYNDGWTYNLNNYFLARGFAVVYSSGVGTYDSQGLRDTGARSEVDSTKAVIEWLAGNRTAFTNPVDQIAIPAWWSNHHVGMTGRSYLGTLTEAVAGTGVKDLNACIVEAGISNYYDYYRDTGLVIGGEDCDVLGEFTFSRRKGVGDYHRIKPKWHKQLKYMLKGEDRKTGNYNKFWDNRNYLKNVHNVKAGMLIVHGLNDWNVKPRNAWNLWQHLQNVPTDKKIVLHQGQHIYINNLQSIDFTDMANLWFSNKLYGADNHANQVIPTVMVQDNTKPETWHTYGNWGHTGHQVTYRFNDHQLDPKQSSSQPLSFKDHLDKKHFDHYCHWHDDWHHDTFSSKPSPMSHNRLLFKSAPLKHDLVVDGVVHLKLRVKSSANVGLLTAFLVDYGKMKRLTKTPQILQPQRVTLTYHWQQANIKDFMKQENYTPFKKIVTAHLNMQNRENCYKVDDLKPNQYVDVDLQFQPTFFHFLPKHRVGLAVCATDFIWTQRGNQKITYTLDPKHCELILPTYEKK